MDEQLKAQLSRLAAGPVRWDCPLGEYTSFGIGGEAEALVVVESVGELANLLQFFADNAVEHRFIGKGSNLLVSDRGFAGVILLFGTGLSRITFLGESPSGEVRIRAEAGCSLGRLLNHCTTEGYAGLEFASGIPGSLGGAVVMNAGARGGEMGDVIDSLTTFTLNSGEETLERGELDFEYRSWRNQQVGDDNRLVISADIRLTRGERGEIVARCREYLEKRKATQPKIEKNAGSFFKNPPEDSAGRLIEAAGLKGERCGGAMVSPVHANFLVNTGEATADDVKRLMGMVVSQVRKDSGVTLKPEVHFL
ncbi:MAG: UDP-N-acetylmuramate dehydrogenase [Thermodesulfobacteriota bacterium]